MSTVVAEDVRTLPPLLGKQGIADLLGVPASTVDDWRVKCLDAARGGRTPDPTHLPMQDRVADNRPFWHPQTIVEWAVQRGLLPVEHGLEWPSRDEVWWSQKDIADYFGVVLDTVRERWRHWYTHAILHKLDVPFAALAPEDLIIDGTPFWRPETIKAWGRKVGKVGRDLQPLARVGLKWVADPEPEVTVHDPIAELIAKGERWRWQEIAAFFGVKVKTAKTWASPHSAGQEFPAPDGGKTLRGIETWLPSTVKAWARQNRRLDENDQPRKVYGGPLPGKPRPKRGPRKKKDPADEMAAA